jgi:hypothetical protein
MPACISALGGRSPPLYQKPLDEKPFGSRVSKPLDKILSTSSKKEDVKKDEQKKIKILKSFVHGLQKHFYKNKEERIFEKYLVQ